MNWKDIGTMAARTAPLLASVLGGPAGVVAGAAGTLIGAFLGVEAEPEKVAQAFKDPQTALRLAELEAKHEARLLEWQQAQLQAELANVQGARAREVAMAKAGHGGAWATALVSLVVVCGFFWMLEGVMSMEDVSEPALLLLGSLGTAFGGVVNYYLGSSLGSFRKDVVSSGTDRAERKLSGAVS
ncbi:hypothetical protein [Oleidesulfovibrio sp.]|uniref:hypothetical protein n=1 Tax=Oleidesulfovibrio sp. TaxID=2909707 RepID=UPI003A8491A5